MTGYRWPLRPLFITFLALMVLTSPALAEDLASDAAHQVQGQEASSGVLEERLKSAGFGAAMRLVASLRGAGADPQVTLNGQAEANLPQGEAISRVEVLDRMEGMSLKVVQVGRQTTARGPFFLQSDRSDLFAPMALWAMGQGKAATALPDGSVQVGPFETSEEALRASEENPDWNASCVASQEESGGPKLYYAVLRVDTSKVQVDPVFAGSYGMGRAPMSFLSQMSKAVAMVNGGYYYSAYPIGTMVHRGIPLGRPIMGRSAVGITQDGSVFFGDGSASFGVSNGEWTLPIGDFNVPPKNGNLSIFYGGAYRPGNQALLSLSVKDRIVQDEPQGADFTLLANGRAAEALGSLNIGDTLQLVRRFAFPAFEACRLVIQGGPMIVENRRYVNRSEGLSRSIRERRHPRTLVGIDEQGLVFMVIDGRNGHSSGVTLEEAANLALEEGLVAALNLDGGGSSQMIWRGVTVNIPSDGKERPLPYGIGLFPR